jgi:hypothetical protein
MSQASLSPGAPTPYLFEDFGLFFCSPLLASLFAMQPELCISFQAGSRLAGRLWRISRVPRKSHFR